MCACELVEYGRRGRTTIDASGGRAGIFPVVYYSQLPVRVANSPVVALKSSITYAWLVNYASVWKQEVDKGMALGHSMNLDLEASWKQHTGRSFDLLGGRVKAREGSKKLKPSQEVETRCGQCSQAFRSTRRGAKIQLPVHCRLGQLQRSLNFTLPKKKKTFLYNTLSQPPPPFSFNHVSVSRGCVRPWCRSLCGRQLEVSRFWQKGSKVTTQPSIRSGPRNLQMVLSPVGNHRPIAAAPGGEEGQLSSDVGLFSELTSIMYS